MCGLPATVLNSLPKFLISSHQDSGDIPKFNRSKIGGASGGVLPRLPGRIPYKDFRKLAKESENTHLAVSAYTLHVG